MLVDGGGDHPPPPHAWRDLARGLQTEAMVLSPGEAILFFGRHSKNEGLPYHQTRDVEFGLGGPCNWAGRSVQINASRKTMQEGHHAIHKAVIEKRAKARGPG